MSGENSEKKGMAALGFEPLTFCMASRYAYHYPTEAAAACSSFLKEVYHIAASLYIQQQLTIPVVNFLAPRIRHRNHLIVSFVDVLIPDLSLVSC